MKPDGVPAQLIETANEAWQAAPQKRDGKPTRMRYALAAVWPQIQRQVLRDAAEALLTEGSHGDLCSYGPPGTCDCALGEHYYRWLIARGEA